MGAQRGGELPLGAAGEGAQNSLTENILWLTNTRQLDKRAKSSLSQQTFVILVANLFTH